MKVKNRINQTFLGYGQSSIKKSIRQNLSPIKERMQISEDSTKQVKDEC